MRLRRLNSATYLYAPGQDEPNVLLGMPEAGPGYQLIAVDAGPILAGTYLVLNAELLIPVEVVLDPTAHVDPWTAELSYDGFKKGLNPPPTNISGLPSFIGAPPGIPPPGKPRSTLVSSSSTTGAERLWRLSAYFADKRIAQNGSVAVGTYLTSDRDVAWINTGLGTAGRYALPNPFPATYGFEIVPPAGLSYSAGTVRPAFGQTGGGVEVVLAAPVPAGHANRFPRLVLPHL
jgi:hypothetical protein